MEVVVRGLLYPNFRLPRKLMQARFRLGVRCPLVFQAQIQGQPLRQSIRRIRPRQMLDDISHELSRPSSLPGVPVLSYFSFSQARPLYLCIYQTRLRIF